MNNDDHLKLENQICFGLYRLSKFVTSKYRPLLEEIDLTYPQYLMMLVLWEKRKVSLKDAGIILSLDSGTLTPLVKRLIAKELVQKTRSTEDERTVFISLTKKGSLLKKKASHIPEDLLCSSGFHSGAKLKKLKELKALLDEVYDEWSIEDDSVL